MRRAAATRGALAAAGVILAALAGATAAGLGSPAPDQPGPSGHTETAKAAIHVPSPIRVATRITIRLTGFTPGEQVIGTVQPRSARGSNGVGRLLFKDKTVPASGSLAIRVLFPRTYFHCAGGNFDCGQQPFVNGERVIISASDASEVVSVVRRVIVPRHGAS